MFKRITPDYPDGLTETRPTGAHPLHDYAVDTAGNLYFFDQFGPFASDTWKLETRTMAGDRIVRADTGALYGLTGLVG